jgi:hypothetical protein
MLTVHGDTRGGDRKSNGRSGHLNRDSVSKTFKVGAASETTGEHRRTKPKREKSDAEAP